MLTGQSELRCAPLFFSIVAGLVCAVGFACSEPSQSSSTDDVCTPGYLNCPCVDGNTCLAGLYCAPRGCELDPTTDATSTSSPNEGTTSGETSEPAPNPDPPGDSSPEPDCNSAQWSDVETVVFSEPNIPVTTFEISTPTSDIWYAEPRYAILLQTTEDYPQLDSLKVALAEPGGATLSTLAEGVEISSLAIANIGHNYWLAAWKEETYPPTNTIAMANIGHSGAGIRKVVAKIDEAAPGGTTVAIAARGSDVRIAYSDIATPGKNGGTNAVVWTVAVDTDATLIGTPKMLTGGTAWAWWPVVAAIDDRYLVAWADLDLVGSGGYFPTTAILDLDGNVVHSGRPYAKVDGSNGYAAGHPESETFVYGWSTYVSMMRRDGTMQDFQELSASLDGVVAGAEKYALTFFQDGRTSIAWYDGEKVSKPYYLADGHVKLTWNPFEAKFGAAIYRDGALYFRQGTLYCK